MPFNDNDFKGFRSQQLKVFCHQVAEIKKTPDLINLVRGEADYVSYCRKITNSDERSRGKFSTFCRANGFDPNEIQIRVCLVATVLGVYKQADYYGILGVAPDADEDAIKQAYRQKAKKLHPDSSDAAQGRSDEFIELHAAYSHLRDPKLRKVYDAIPDLKGPWVEGSQTAASPIRRPSFGRVASWLCLFLGGVVIFAYAFDVYQNKSKQIAPQQPTVPSHASKTPELYDSQTDNAEIVHSVQPLPPIQVEQNPEPDQALSKATEPDGMAPEPASPAEPEDAQALMEIVAVNKRIEAANAEVVHHDVEHKSAGKTIKDQKTSQPKRKTIPKTKRPRVTKKLPREKPGATAVKTIAAMETAGETDNSPVYIVQKERVLSFLDKYTRSYEERDLDKFKAFFSNNATEQGQPFKKLIPRYQKTFKNIKSMDYKIELGSLSMEKGGRRIYIDGDFKAQFRLVNNRTGENRGSIRMELLDDPKGLLVTRLDYEIGP